MDTGTLRADLASGSLGTSVGPSGSESHAHHTGPAAPALHPADAVAAMIAATAVPDEHRSAVVDDTADLCLGDIAANVESLSLGPSCHLPWPCWHQLTVRKGKRGQERPVPALHAAPQAEAPQACVSVA
jgi:hypothetical protein